VKVGDVVNFTSNSWVFAGAVAGYENPGVILEDRSGEGAGSRYLVLWADKKLTVEYVSYLRLGEKQ
jgi:hypothetical protein